MKHWESDEWIVFMFALSICLFLLSIIYNGIINGVILTDMKAKLVTGVIGSIVAIISVWFGHKINKK